MSSQFSHPCPSACMREKELDAYESERNREGEETMLHIVSLCRYEHGDQIKPGKLSGHFCGDNSNI